ncbi:MAG: hypothetical protein ACLFU9_03570 [Candidatus Bathyarchaeia archaeon]
MLRTARPVQSGHCKLCGRRLEKAEGKKYDVVASDYQMPGKNGLQFLETLRKG